MSEKKVIQFLLITYWVFFYLTTVIDKIVPDVFPLWVGADFYSLFIKFFVSLGLSNPLYATVALAIISLLEVIAFVSFLLALINLFSGKKNNAEQWFYRGIVFSLIIFSLFTIADQVFGDRFTLLEHTIFWIMLLVSWVVYRLSVVAQERIIKFSFPKRNALTLLLPAVILLLASLSIIKFSGTVIKNKKQPVMAEEVAQGVYKFEFPFLGDKITMENTLSNFEKNHPDVHIRFIYTGPEELNAKKKTHLLLYVFTGRKK